MIIERFVWVEVRKSNGEEMYYYITHPIEPKSDERTLVILGPFRWSHDLGRQNIGYD